MKRALIFLLVVLLLAAASPVLATERQNPCDDEMLLLRQRMARLMERYPVGSYFTDNGQACTHHYECSTMEDCNCKVVGAEEAGTAGNMQCFGFARMVFYGLFGLPYPHFNSERPWQNAQGEESGNVRELWSFAPKGEESDEQIREALSQCRFGDVLQTGLPHSMVIVETVEQGITVYDANFDMRTCGVKMHTLSWEELTASFRRYGMSLYRCVNYPLLNEAARLECVLLPEKGLLADGSTPVGLTFCYSKADYRCILVCREDGVFVCDDGIRQWPVLDPLAESLTLSVKAGERFDTGTLRFSFRDAVWESTEEVLVSPEGILDAAAPEKREYFVGESLCVEGAYLYLAHPQQGRIFCFADELSFDGFDSSAAGEITVTMEAFGYQKEFTVKILPRPLISPSSAAPSVPDGREPSSVWLTGGIALVLLLLGGAAFVLWKKKKGTRTNEAPEYAVTPVELDGSVTEPPLPAPENGSSDKGEESPSETTEQVPEEDTQISTASEEADSSDGEEPNEPEQTGESPSQPPACDQIGTEASAQDASLEQAPTEAKAPSEKKPPSRKKKKRKKGKGKKEK